MPTPNDTTVSNPNDALPSIIEYITKSGVQIYVTPLSLFTIQAIIAKSEDIYPYPSERDYRLTEQLNESGEMVQAADVIASGFFPASENPKYIAICKEIDTQRLEWQNHAFIELACKYPQYADSLEMLAAFRPQLEALRPYVEMPEDEWQALLEFCVFTGSVDLIDSTGKRLRTSERHTVIQLARQNSNQALTTPEVVGAMRVFRLRV